MNQEFLRRLSLALFVLPISLATTSLIFDGHLDTQVLEPLSQAYKTTDVVLARNQLKEALKGIEENQQAEFLTSIPRDNHKVEAWKREIEEYQEQLDYRPKSQLKSIDSMPSMPKVINWSYVALLFFLFLPVTVILFFTFGIVGNAK